MSDRALTLGSSKSLGNPAGATAKPASQLRTEAQTWKMPQAQEKDF